MQLGLSSVTSLACDLKVSSLYRQAFAMSTYAYIRTHARSARANIRLGAHKLQTVEYYPIRRCTLYAVGQEMG